MRELLREHVVGRYRLSGGVGVIGSDTVVALARCQYRILRVPLQTVETVGGRYFQPTAPLQLVYERILIDCDETAAPVLQDGWQVRQVGASTAQRDHSPPG